MMVVFQLTANEEHANDDMTNKQSKHSSNRTGDGLALLKDIVLVGDELGPVVAVGGAATVERSDRAVSGACSSQILQLGARLGTHARARLWGDHDRVLTGEVQPNQHKSNTRSH
jgi:hypothetical protein